MPDREEHKHWEMFCPWCKAQGKMTLVVKLYPRDKWACTICPWREEAGETEEPKRDIKEGGKYN